MSSIVESIPPSFRLPFHTASPNSPTAFIKQLPVEDLILGNWYMKRSSNGFWKDKRDVRIQYNDSAAGAYMEDHAFYQTLNSEAVKSIAGKDTKCEEGVGMYLWQGRKGFLRLASARWEILSYSSCPNGRDWMLVYAHKSIFTSPAINLMCRNQDGVSEEDMDMIQGWLHGVSDSAFQQTVQGMVDIL